VLYDTTQCTENRKVTIQPIGLMLTLMQTTDRQFNDFMNITLFWVQKYIVAPCLSKSGVYEPPVHP